MIRFSGFGLNLRTSLLVLLIAATLAGTLVVAKPIVVGEGSKASAVTAPCVPWPEGWRRSWTTIEDAGVGWSIYIHAQLKYNRCDVMIVAGTQSCYTGILFLIGFENWNCSNYRVNVDTAYSEYVVLRGAWAVKPFFNGAPVTVSNHFLCARYDRRGQHVAEYEGPYVARNCGYA